MPAPSRPGSPRSRRSASRSPTRTCRTSRRSRPACASRASASRWTRATTGCRRRSGPGEDEGCPFDRAPKLSDEEGLIVARGELVYAVLNLYPYNAGHVLICPFRHVADYTDLTQAETAEFSEFTKRAVGALRQASGAQGF